MIAKFFAQIVFSALVVQMLPADASYFEFQVGAGRDFSLHEIVSEFPESDIREVREYPIKVDTDSYGVLTSAESAIIEDANSGMVMLAKRPDQQRSIGSVTKLMTALVFLDQNPDLNQTVTLDPTLDLIEGGRIYLAFYDGLLLHDVLGASIVGSDNTATESLMRFSGLEREEFIKKMNEKAFELGMGSTSFVDPTGIDAGNMSTARDLVKLVRASEEPSVLSDFMQTEKLYIQHESGRVIEIENTNTLLESFLNDGEYVIRAGKTGYLPQAGYVLATSVDHNGDKVYVVVLGSDSKEQRIADAKGLASWAFKVFKW